ncbi:hypothetical protein Q7W15_09960, partial [Streptococcus suis]|nr:hypothetical protein [Streptococcus suis]
NKDGITTYTYDKNGNRTASKKNDEKLDYIYDTENRLLAVKDKEGFLMAALYDGDDNRVFTASRKEGKNTYNYLVENQKIKVNLVENRHIPHQMEKKTLSSGMVSAKMCYRLFQHFHRL